MKVFSVEEDRREPLAKENQVPKGSSIKSVAWRKPTTRRAKAATNRTLLLGAMDQAARGSVSNSRLAFAERF
ncbi:MAG: hypothetical protein JRM80_02535 [Nitrososphaerota archaeon]|nr:hypothetical protein [Nitrososphaerota archaeon]